MAYSVVWLRDETVLGTSPFDDLGSAVRHAKAQFPIKMSRIGATSVEVRDETGKCHLTHAMPPEPDGAEPAKRARLGLRR